VLAALASPDGDREDVNETVVYSLATCSCFHITRQCLSLVT